MDFIKLFVIPAQAGIQDPSAPALALDPRFRARECTNHEVPIPLPWFAGFGGRV